MNTTADINIINETQEPITIENARALLGEDYKHLSDDEILKLVDVTTDIIHLFFNSYLIGKT